MDQEDLGFLPATELAELIRTKQLSPVEYMRSLLTRIETLEPKVNAFAYLAADRAMDAARQWPFGLLKFSRNSTAAP